MGKSGLCPQGCRYWNSIHDTDPKVTVGEASEGLCLTAERDLKPDEVVSAFGKSIILKGRITDEAHELMINFHTTCTVGKGFQYSIRRKLASETDHSIVMPSADRLLALSQKGISSGLHKAPKQRTGDRGWAHLANHTCCALHRNARLEVLSVTSSDGDDNGSQATEMKMAARPLRWLPFYERTGSFPYTQRYSHAIGSLQVEVHINICSRKSKP